MSFIEKARNSFFSVLAGTGLAFFIGLPILSAESKMSPWKEMDESLSRSLRIVNSISEKSRAARLACDDILKTTDTVRIGAHRKGAKHP